MTSLVSGSLSVHQAAAKTTPDDRSEMMYYGFGETIFDNNCWPVFRWKTHAIIDVRVPTKQGGQFQIRSFNPHPTII
jgi:hypothetical protein